MLTRRTNILLDDNLWELLTSAAKREKSSVGEIVRNAVRKIYSDDSLMEQKKKAFEAIKKLRVRQKGVTDYKALINEGRRF